MPEEAFQNDAQFFNATLQSESAQAVMRDFGLTADAGGAKTYVGNAVLVIAKHGWLIPAKPPCEKSIRLHYEFRTRGEVRLEVELFPYPGTVKSEQMELWKPALELKERCLSGLRELILKKGKLDSSLGATRKDQGEPSNAGNQCAVKFVSGLPRDCSPEAFAEFFGQVVRSVTPLVDDFAQSQRATLAAE